MRAALIDRLKAVQLCQTLLTEEDLTHSKVLPRIAATVDCTSQDLMSHKVTWQLGTLRRVAIYVLRQRFGLRYSEIGRLLGERNHATLIRNYQDMGHTLTEWTSAHPKGRTFQDPLRRALAVYDLLSREEDVTLDGVVEKLAELSGVEVEVLIV